MATQQRMYDAAGTAADDADRLLGELGATLGLPKRTTVPTQRAGTPPPLVEIRSHIGEVARWAADSKPVAESLLRSKVRLTQSSSAGPRGSVNPVAVPAPRKRALLAVFAAVAVVLIVAVIVVVAIAR